MTTPASILTSTESVIVMFMMLNGYGQTEGDIESKAKVPSGTLRRTMRTLSNKGYKFKETSQYRPGEDPVVLVELIQTPGGFINQKPAQRPTMTPKQAVPVQSTPPVQKKEASTPAVIDVVDRVCNKCGISGFFWREVVENRGRRWTTVAYVCSMELGGCGSRWPLN